MYGGDKLRKFIKVFSSITSAFLLIVLSLIIYGNIIIPDSFSVSENNLSFAKIFTAEVDFDTVSIQVSNSNYQNDESFTATVKLANTVPIKTIEVYKKERNYVIAGGELIGIKLIPQGVLIVGTEAFECETTTVSPAENAGIEIGDVLLSINGNRITNNEDLTNAIANSNGAVLELVLSRDGEEYTTTLKPEKTKGTNCYKGGLWVKDCTCGIGTLTYINVSNGTLASLGHGIYDSDTQEIVPSTSGFVLSANLSSVTKSKIGSAGELCGSLGTQEYGTLSLNCDNGIYGFITVLPDNTQLIPVAFANEVQTGKAQIITTVSNGQKKYYDIEIQKTDTSSKDNKSMVIKITDEELLNTTGGIVQGMSGSPIIQNGMLVGAVTHVFLNNPQMGYAIFAETMLDTAQTILDKEESPAA